MNKVKESTLYLQFLKRNFALFLVAIVLALLTTGYFYQARRTDQIASQYWEVSSRVDQSVGSIAALQPYLDHLIGLIRMQAPDLSQNEGVEITAVKVTPLSFLLTIKGDASKVNRVKVLNSLNNVMENVKTEAAIKDVELQSLTEVKIYQSKQSIFKQSLLAFFIGILSAHLLSLIREYLRKY